MNHQDLINACQHAWQRYTGHEFVRQLASGNLAQEAYLHYLKQDFLFLKQYARAYALAIYKARNLSEMRAALPALHALLDSEIAHHVSYCADWGVSEQDMEVEVEDFGTVAYTRYVLDTGNSGDLTDLMVALAPCAIGYGEIGKTLIADADTQHEGNPYLSWIQLYGGDEFQQGVADSARQLDALLAEIPVDSARARQLCHIFNTATRMEVAFWQQAIDALSQN
jgi:thiaminase/transcriptional activator TenA